MSNHLRRFSLPSQPPPPMMGAVVPASIAPAKVASPMATLAAIYALAQEQAREMIHQRQWDELLSLLFDPQI